MTHYFESIDETFRPKEEKEVGRREKAERDVNSGKYAEMDAVEWEAWQRNREELAQLTRDKIDADQGLASKLRAMKLKDVERSLKRDVVKARARREVLEERKKMAGPQEPEAPTGATP